MWLCGWMDVCIGLNQTNIRQFESNLACWYPQTILFNFPNFNFQAGYPQNPFKTTLKRGFQNLALTLFGVFLNWNLPNHVGQSCIFLTMFVLRLCIKEGAGGSNETNLKESKEGSKRIKLLRHRFSLMLSLWISKKNNAVWHYSPFGCERSEL